MFKNQFYLSILLFIILLSAAAYSQNKTGGILASKADNTSSASLKVKDTASASLNINLFFFRQKLSDLYRSIKDRTKDRSELIDELNALMKDELSKDAEFYNAVYIELPQMLQAWASGNYLLYSVRPGDCLWNITSIYTKGDKWPRIFEANKDAIGNPNVIYPKQLLKIPKKLISKYIDTTDEATTSKPSVENLNEADTSNNTQASTQTKDNSPENFSLGGIIVDETITKLGHDFYDLFYSNFQVPEGVQDYNINIIEKPQPRLGTMITVKLNDLEIFQSFLQPKYDIIEGTAFAALDQCIAYLQNYEAIIKELQGEDMDGNGIY